MVAMSCMARAYTSLTALGQYQVGPRSLLESSGAIRKLDAASATDSRQTKALGCLQPIETVTQMAQGNAYASVKPNGHKCSPKVSRRVSSAPLAITIRVHIFESSVF